MEAKLVMIVVEGCIKLVRPVDAAPIDDHDDLFAGLAESCHHLVDILAQLLRIKVGDDFIEDFRGAILDRADHAEQHATRDAAPSAILQPRLAFEAFFAFDLTLAQGTSGQTRTLGFPPPARTGEGKAPQDRFVFIEQNDLATASLIFEGGQFERAISEISRGGIQSAGGAVEAQRVFFNRQRTLSRPSWTPVSRAKTVASSRQLHWEETAPCWRGSWSTRRLRCCSSSHVIVGGRPERARSSKPWGPSCAKRCTHLRRAEFAKWKVAETVEIWCPATTARTAWARRKTRASLACLSIVSKVVSA